MRIVRHPVLCNYYLTYRCNARCSFCDIWERPSPYATEENVAQNLRDLKRLKVKIIDFTGGEPLLHRKLPVFLKAAKELGFITTVTTNALLYPKQAEVLRGLVDMLHFSLDGPDAETHNASRGVACFDFVMRSLKIARELGERPDLLYTVTDNNIDTIEEVYKKIALPNNAILILNPVFYYNEVGEEMGGIALSALRKWAWKRKVYINEAFLSLRKDGGNSVSRPVCLAGSTSIVISPENKLLAPCYHLADEAFPIDGNLYDVWRSPEARTARAKEGRLPGCEGCTVNCYMQPSFAVKINKYFFQALPSTLKYSVEKWALR